MWVYVKKVVFFGVGVIVLIEILFRSKVMGFFMSDSVGQNMSGNGDMLVFGYNIDRYVNGMGKLVLLLYNFIGLMIMSVIDNWEGYENLLDGYVIEEGVIFYVLLYFFQVMLDFMLGKKDLRDDIIIEKMQVVLVRWGFRFLGFYFKNGVMEWMQVYLVMLYDSNQVMLLLKDDKFVLEFFGVVCSYYVKKFNNILEWVIEYVGGILVYSFFYGIMGQQIMVYFIG